jgi:hypothetical protein
MAELVVTLMPSLRSRNFRISSWRVGGWGRWEMREMREMGEMGEIVNKRSVSPLPTNEGILRGY